MGLRCVRALGAGALLGGLLALSVPVFGAPVVSAGTPLQGASNCPMFPADNVWNTPIANLPVDPHSAAWLSSMAASSTNLPPDFGPSGDPSTPNAPVAIPFEGMPVNAAYVSATVGVAFAAGLRATAVRLLEQADVALSEEKRLRSRP